MNWDKVFSRLSVPGLTLLVLGIAAVTQSTRLSRLLWKDRGERAILPIKLTGLVLAVLGTLILLDVIPGL